ncbi:MAG: tyrosine-protein kinase family protein [Desulfuromonadales bacterium]|nr:tyrosine-protein kinase family protein [Desulfuromonadales bacterium]
MSRIEKAMEKAAQLRNVLGGSEVIHEVKMDTSQQPTRLHVPPPPIDNDEIKPQIQNPLLATLCDPHSLVSEEYRKLKSAVISFAQQDEFKNVIMVTSSVSCEGKSLVALNLAVTLAQEYDHTVLLVDADLRKPSSHVYLGLKPEKGLSDYLSGESSLSDILIKTGVGRLSLLPAGTPLRNPVELFSSQKMKEFISEIKNRYPDRFIIIDTPPVLPFAELRSLTALADGVLFVIREGAVTPENISEALHALDGSKLIGAVYNDASTVSQDKHSHYYYYGHGKSGQQTTA